MKLIAEVKNPNHVNYLTPKYFVTVQNETESECEFIGTVYGKYSPDVEKHNIKFYIAKEVEVVETIITKYSIKEQ